MCYDANAVCNPRTKGARFHLLLLLLLRFLAPATEGLLNIFSSKIHDAPFATARHLLRLDCSTAVYRLSSHWEASVRGKKDWVYCAKINRDFMTCCGRISLTSRLEANFPGRQYCLVPPAP